MNMQVRAIFENGLLRPLQAVQLAEKQEVTLTIEGEKNADPEAAHFILPDDRWQMFCDALDAPPREIAALRKLLTQASILDGKADPAANAGPA